MLEELRLRKLGLRDAYCSRTLLVPSILLPLWGDRARAR